MDAKKIKKKKSVQVGGSRMYNSCVYFPFRLKLIFKWPFLFCSAHFLRICCSRLRGEAQLSTSCWWGCCLVMRVYVNEGKCASALTTAHYRDSYSECLGSMCHASTPRENFLRRACCLELRGRAVIHHRYQWL